MDRTSGQYGNYIIKMPRENRAETRGLEIKNKNRGIIEVVWKYFIRKMNSDIIKY